MPVQTRWSLGLVLVVILALGARTLYALHFSAEALLADVDARGYDQLAANIASGHGFSMDAAEPRLPDTIRTPGYPLLVAALYRLFGRQPRAVVLVQALLDAALCLVLWPLTRRLTGSRGAALCAGLLYALNPTAWHYANALLTEIPLASVVTWAAWVLVSGRDAPSGGLHSVRLAVLGALCGLAILIKPNTLLLPGIAILCLPLLRRATVRLWLAESAAVLLGALLVVAPWVIRNAVVTGRPILSSAFDDNLAHVSAVATLARARHEVVAPWSARWEAIYETILAEAVRRYHWPATPPRTAREVDERRQQLATVAAEIIRRHPAAFAAGQLDGFLRSWVPREHREWYEILSGRSWDSLHSAEGVAGEALAALRAGGPAAALHTLWQQRLGSLPPLALGLWAGFIVLYGLAAALLAAGSWSLRRAPGFLLFVWLALLYVTLLPGPISYDRFRVPALALMSVVMAAGLVRLWPRALDTARLLMHHARPAVSTDRRSEGG